MLYHLTRLATRLAWFAVGYITLRVIIAALEEWYRKSELSCDRAGVLGGQDPAAARRALMKLAGGSRMPSSATTRSTSRPASTTPYRTCARG